TAMNTCSSTCIPQSACPAGKNCGTMDNGCGTAMLTCGGACPAGQTCGGGNPGVANVCGCTPLPLATACGGLNCDPVSNGCGGAINCGTCPTGQTCVSNRCVCSANCTGVMCGGSDGCGGVCSQGTCPAGQTCGGGGTPNVCGSPPCVPDCTNAQ